MIKTATLLIAVLLGSAVLGVAQENIKARVIAITDDTVTVEVHNPPGGETVAGLSFFVGTQNDAYHNFCPKSILFPGYTRTFVVDSAGPRFCDYKSPPDWELACGTDHWMIITAENDDFNQTPPIYFTTSPCP